MIKYFENLMELHVKMSLRNFLIMAMVVATNLKAIQGHGKVVDPVHRGSAWRLGFKTPINYNDMENYCGGVFTQYRLNDGKCGPCGDNYAHKVPRANENGGTYGTGTIVKTYKAGETMNVSVHVTAAHRGFFEFSLCPLNSTSDVETEECFDAHKLKLADGGYKHTNIFDSKHYRVKVVLPADMTCEHCVFRWHYRAGNIWGRCEDGNSRIGCGIQEIFRTCSDIKIV